MTKQPWRLSASRACRGSWSATWALMKEASKSTCSSQKICQDSTWTEKQKFDKSSKHASEQCRWRRKKNDGVQEKNRQRWRLKKITRKVRDGERIPSSLISASYLAKRRASSARPFENDTNKDASCRAVSNAPLASAPSTFCRSGCAVAVASKQQQQ